ncbi:DUF1287 domain-containing protein [Sphingomonas sp. DG1-23]|uniref:DUF1287 domain-containing protein n=1 Tax=Sphingomonas sp. DG1-23 TaxID=3068316 RepID=UPI00273E5181|nr:DUF1287 domain-containing protein [Sphingomonas sp. DG1-23]MDP5278798.1 DUF1287 domain-containing protein [Sphingomonas sp. DG1-23]
MQIIDRRTLFLGMAAGLAGCGAAQAPATPVARQRLPSSDRAGKLLAAARAQVGVTLHYDPAYTSLAFPGGDVPREKGVCTDVLIRAYRDAFGIDLQVLVNADMRKAFAAYPKKWGLRRPDRNIDHRRVPNLARFFARMGAELPVPADGKGWQPGDIFTSAPSNGAGGNVPHIGFVSDLPGAQGPLILHNIGRGAREEDALRAWPITGRFRWKV